MDKDNDPFAWRSGGGKFNIGDDEDDSTSALIEVDGQLFCITKKNIRSIIMADTIDPKRTNPGMRHSQQQVLPYGSENHFVGRTLQQASILFEKHSLLPNIDCKRGISIAFSFLKEITSLDKIKNEYAEEENTINSNFDGKSHSDGSFYLPSLPNLEQKVKGFISNSDHAMRSIMEITNLFYPNIIGKGWEEKLLSEIKLNSPKPGQFVIFTEQFKEFTERLRTIRSKIEHPYGLLKDYTLTIENYKLTTKNKVETPSISFQGENYNLPKMGVTIFMESTIDNLLAIFESLMAYLCDIHTKPFADEKRVVVFIPEDKRQESEKHVGFKYQILWTK